MSYLTLLLCTVGGSHQPIVSAIKELSADRVFFICSENDSATGRPGSVSQITGTGMCIKANPLDAKPSLPAIPQQAGLQPEQYQVFCAPADDLDAIYLVCRNALRTALRDFPGARWVADYTGGTKSMSAALVLAALEDPAVELQIVTGNRGDLIKVRDGSQYVALANYERIRFERLAAPFRECWSRFAYSEAEAGFKGIAAPRDPHLRGRLFAWRDLSRAFAAWDGFDHATPQTIIQDYAPKLPNSLKEYLPVLSRLNDTRDTQKRDAARLFDLYRNAERRAAQGRYDDAVARLYRLWEWSAQWILKTRCGIDTSDIPADWLPKDMPRSPNSRGKIQTGLFDSWKLVKRKKSDSIAAHFFMREENTLRNLLETRNLSILAHGFEPVTHENWAPIIAWTENQFLPMLLEETRSHGIRELPPQLPHHDAWPAMAAKEGE